MCSRWKIKYILFKTTYPNINISVLCYRSANTQSLTDFLKYIFAEKYGYFSPKIGEKKIVKIRFRKLYD